MKLSSNKHLTRKTCWLLALTLAIKVSKLHGLSYQLRYSEGWRSCIFSFVPNFVAKTQNPPVLCPKFYEFTVSSWMDFVVRDIAVPHQSNQEVPVQDKEVLFCLY